MFAFTGRGGCRRRAPGVRRRRRAGMAMVLALLYLTLFAALALGFYAQTNIGAQVAANESRSIDAQLGAECGLTFIRYHLSRIDVPSGTAPDKVLEQVYGQLAAVLDGTPNLRSGEVGYAAATASSPAVITIPAADNQAVRIDSSGKGFRAVITESGGTLKVKVTGRSPRGAVSRAVQMSFARAGNGSRIFDYAVASRGPIRIGTTIIDATPTALDASLFSSTTANPAVTMGSNAVVAGDIYLSNPKGAVSITSSASLGGSTINAVRDTHVHAGVAPPAFPSVDSSIFWPYVLNADGTPNYYTSAAGKNLVNCVLKPGSYNFSSQMTIKGVLYIQTPCTVNFGGGVAIQGVVVVQNNPTGTPSQNVLNFQGNGTFQGVETLTPSASFPPDLIAKSGAVILAPSFTLNFGGNFGTTGGSIVADRVNFGGTSTGTVRGTVIGLGAGGVDLTGKQISVDHTAIVRNPAGLVFGHAYQPQLATYTEVQP